jgi:chromosome segregation ATPase
MDKEDKVNVAAASQAIGKLLVITKGLQGLSDLVRLAENGEQVVKELQDKADRVRGEIEDLAKQRKAAQDNIAKAESQAAVILAEGNTNASSAVSLANAEAEGIIARAKEKLDEATKKASVAENAMQVASIRKADLEAEIKVLEEKAASAREAVKTILGA